MNTIPSDNMGQSMNAMPGGATEQTLKQLSEDWADAELHGDIAFLEQILTDDFVGIGPRGFTLTKEDWLQRHRSGDLRYETLTWDDMKTRIYEGAAIVTERQTQKVRYQDQVMENQLRTMLVFVKQQGHWLLAGLQYSPIAGPPPSAPQAG